MTFPAEELEKLHGFLLGARGSVCELEDDKHFRNCTARHSFTATFLILYTQHAEDMDGVFRGG